MTDEQLLQQFVNDVYLTRYNRQLTSFTSTGGLAEIAKTIRYTNMFLDELESEADWQELRENDEDLATIAGASQVIPLPADVDRLVKNAERPLVLMTGDSIIARFEVVDPNQITRRAGEYSEDRVAVVGRNLVFSRQFTDNEIGAHVHADTQHYFTRLSSSPVNVDLFDEVPSYQLLVLGVAKNATLPDIVQGGLSPSFVQKYGDELQKAIAINDASSDSDTVIRDDYSSISGIY